MKDEASVAAYFSRDSRRFDAIYDARRQRNPLQRLIDVLFRRRDLRKRLEICLSMLGESRTVLEVGCGSGRVSVAVVSAGAEHVTGIDISDAMVELSRQLADQMGVAQRCSFVCASADSFRPEQTFDAVVAIGVMDYVANPRELLLRMKELTADRVVVSFPRRGMILNAPRRLWLATKKCPVYFYDRAQIDELFSTSGLELLDVIRFGSAPASGSFMAVGRREQS